MGAPTPSLVVLRAGAAFILSQEAAWWPSEVRRIALRDIDLSGDGWKSAVVRLGGGRGAKVRREKSALFDASQQLELRLLRRRKLAVERVGGEAAVAGLTP